MEKEEEEEEKEEEEERNDGIACLHTRFRNRKTTWAVLFSPSTPRLADTGLLNSIIYSKHDHKQ